MVIKRFSLAAVFALSVMLILAGCAGSLNHEGQLKTTTLQIQKAVQSELDNLDRDLSGAASKLSGTGLSGPEARQILNELCSKHPFIIDSCTTDAAGKMVTVAPEAYSSYEGTDISTQDPTVKLRETKEPMLSQVFTAVEGMDAVVIMWPILSEKGDFIGSISALFNPKTLLAMVAEPMLKGTGIALNVMQLDGLNIYDSEGADTGKNLFTDPSFQPYKELIELGRRMVAEESGTGSYTFTSQTTGKTVKKQAFWVSVGLHGTAWRLVSVQEVAEVASIVNQRTTPRAYSFARSSASYK
ncbi:MAG: cache domain-containing protein [Dehalococcoidia bacterium]|nr:cache domain-containing protein [Dehalococcoidia bacterium]